PSFPLHCYLFRAQVAKMAERYASVEDYEERRRRITNLSERCGVLGSSVPRVRSQSHAQRAEGLHRRVPYRRCRIAAAQVHHWSVRSSDTASGAGDGAKGIRSQTRGAGSGCRKEGGEKENRCRSDRGFVGNLHCPSCLSEPLSCRNNT